MIIRIEDLRRQVSDCLAFPVRISSLPGLILQQHWCMIAVEILQEADGLLHSLFTLTCIVDCFRVLIALGSTELCLLPQRVQVFSNLATELGNFLFQLLN